MKKINRKAHLIATLIALTTIAWYGSGRAQGLNSPLGAGTQRGGGVGSEALATLPLLSGEDLGTKRHVGPTGKPCLTLTGKPEAERFNPKLFQHIIIALNDCSHRIKLQVCYYQSEHCLPMNVPPYGRDEAILGIMPSMPAFRFQFREQFDPF